MIKLCNHNIWLIQTEDKITLIAHANAVMIVSTVIELNMVYLWWGGVTDDSRCWHKVDTSTGWMKILTFKFVATVVNCKISSYSLNKKYQINTKKHFWIRLFKVWTQIIG